MPAGFQKAGGSWKLINPLTILRHSANLADNLLNGLLMISNSTAASIFGTAVYERVIQHGLTVVQF